MASARKRKRKSPLSRLKPSRGLVSVLLSILTLVVLAVALLAESLLYGIVSALSGLATVMQIRWAQQRAREDLRKAAGKPRTRRPRPATKTPPVDRPDGETPPPTPGVVVLCTETGRKVDDCPCASRHVATADGARRYGLPVGSPLGRRTRASRVSPTVQRS